MEMRAIANLIGKTYVPQVVGEAGVEWQGDPCPTSAEALERAGARLKEMTAQPVETPKSAPRRTTARRTTKKR